MTDNAPIFREMYMSDLPSILAIIEAHDDDDAEAAEADYHDTGFDNQFVLEIDGQAVGVTGFRPVPATDNTAWLSWTYLAEAHRGKGLGKQMLHDLIEKFKAVGGRKLFVKLSDYVDENGNGIYEAALAAYQSVGFVEELKGDDFYDENENQLMLSLSIQGGPPPLDDKVQEEKPVIRFEGMYEIAETEGSFTFAWTVKEKSFFSKRSFSVEDLTVGLSAVKSEGGRKVFITFPSNLPLIHQPLQAAGFKFVGKLNDYYEQGVDELHFTHDLSNIN